LKKISHKTKSGLDKQNAGDAYESTISRLYGNVGQDDHLSTQAIKDMEKGIVDIKAGRVYTSVQVKKRLGLK